MVSESMFHIQRLTSFGSPLPFALSSGQEDRKVHTDPRGASRKARACGQAPCGEPRSQPRPGGQCSPIILLAPLSGALFCIFLGTCHAPQKAPVCDSQTFQTLSARG